MKKITILTTPKSITIVDADGNKVSVIKTANGLLFQSSIETPKKNKTMLAIQMSIKAALLNPKDDRDNYKVRFNRLAKELTGVDSHSLVSIKNALEKEKAIAA